MLFTNTCEIYPQINIAVKQLWQNPNLTQSRFTHLQNIPLVSLATSRVAQIESCVLRARPGVEEGTWRVEGRRGVWQGVCRDRCARLTCAWRGVTKMEGRILVRAAQVRLHGRVLGGCRGELMGGSPSIVVRRRS